jgi:hypothetical protein
MALTSKLRKYVGHWPISLVAIGVVLTLGWIAIVLCVPVRLLILT